MSNHHLKNKELTLKAKGLLSQMLSLPEDWDYTLSGLSAINRESKDAIRSAVNELEKAGYIRRRQTVDERGKFSGNEYVIYEQPSRCWIIRCRKTRRRKSVNGKPSPENPTQLSKDIPPLKESNTDLSKTIQFLSFRRNVASAGSEKKRCELRDMKSIEKSSRRTSATITSCKTSRMTMTVLMKLLS